MTKIYKDAKDVPVAATIIYTTQPEGGSSLFAFKDSEHTTKFSKEELLDAFLKGCLVVLEGLEGYLKPCQIITNTHSSGYYTITVPFVDPGDEPALSYVMIQSAVDEA